MAYSPDLPIVELAFGSGSTVGLGRPVDFSVHEVGRLRMTTGALAATDPFVTPNPPPFTRRIASGTYPVSVAVARFGDTDGDERVAYARVMITSEAPVRWELAVAAGQDVARLGSDEFFGYGVDSGTGCFMDAAAGPLLDSRMADDYMQLVDDMQEHDRDTWSWLVLQPDAEREENVVFFSTGWGDGSYPTFFGLDETGNVAVALTDFILLDHGDTPTPDPPTQSGGPSRRPWWRFWSRSS